MGQVSFGEVLRQTRERKGLDLTATAHRLRIRPDIIRAIEDSNFSAMPQKGYARNMVNGYARFLGLDSSEITRMYLEDLNCYELDIQRKAAEAHVSDHNAQRMGNTDRAITRPSRSSRRTPRGRGSQSRTASSGHRDVRPQQHSGARKPPSAQEHNRHSRPMRAADNSMSHALFSDRHGLSRNEPRNNQEVHYAHASVVPHVGYTNFYSGPKVAPHVSSRMPFIIAAVIILVLIIVLSVFFAPHGSTTHTDVPTIPVTGLDSSSSESNTDSSAAETAPTKFTFTYQIADGASVWVVVSIDGQNQQASTITGPSEQSFDCSSSLEFTTGTTQGVTALIDGTPVDLTQTSSGGVDQTFTFSDILAQWNANHQNS
ncbi:MAG: helix-turn-helix domain-containing protein [Eggerthellaceae bacterium]|jgi:hypothetical protein|nr:helix-turn-helix domain-containing protein [Eggerthellaceae bacterium]MCH4221115.1 helix-turn-helix domain-containing protein [Eggerthellaceae bacterium]